MFFLSDVCLCNEQEHIARGSELEIHVEKLSKEKKDYVEEIKVQP